jgi:hypothetical protein
MTINAIWRYPVKSMAGERMPSAQLTHTGLVGDRVVQVYDRRGQMVTARTFPRLLQLHATLGLDGEPLVDGLPWRLRDMVRRVDAPVEPGAQLRRRDDAHRFDILPLLVCTPVDKGLAEPLFYSPTCFGRLWHSGGIHCTHQWSL